MRQLVTPNVSINTIDFGMCLWWVQQTVGAVHAFNTALDEWNANLDNHAGSPPSLWVPIFFTIKGNPAGHVCWSAPDGSVYSTSSSTSLTPVHHASIDALNQYYGGRLTYLGWSEIVSNIRIVKENEMISFGMLQQLSHAVLGRREPVTKAWYDSNPAERNMTTDQVLDVWIPSQEAKDFRYKAWDYDRLAKSKVAPVVTEPLVKGKLYEVK